MKKVIDEENIIQTFNWKELDGKQLTVVMGTDKAYGSDFYVVSLYDPKTEKFYVVEEKINKEVVVV